jgi:hypothetical protein
MSANPDSQSNPAKEFICEMRDELAGLRRSSRRAPFEQRETIYNRTELARTLGVSRMSIWRYSYQVPDFPPLPTLKIVARRWAEKWGLPRKRGPAPSARPERAA